MNTEAPTAPARPESRALLYIGAGIVGLVIISVIVVLLLGRASATQFAADSPEGAFQRYLTAYEEGDYDAAYAHFSTRVQEEMPLEEFRQSAQMYGPYGGMGDMSRRVLLQGSTGDGDRIRLELAIEWFYSDGLSTSTSRQPLEVNMVREDGEWRIDDALAGTDPMMPFGPEF